MEHMSLNLPLSSRPSAASRPGRRSGQGATSIGAHLANDANFRTPDARQLTLVRERGRHSILVVDDAPAARYAAARLLRAAGFKSIEASGGAEALRLGPTASAVVLDVHLPDIHGFEVCRLLRAAPATASLPVIHVSAVYVTEEDIAASRAAGADAYLTAPVSADKLVKTLDELLGIVARLA